MQTTIRGAMQIITAVIITSMLTCTKCEDDDSLGPPDGDGEDDSLGSPDGHSDEVGPPDGDEDSIGGPDEEDDIGPPDPDASDKGDEVPCAEHATCQGAPCWVALHELLPVPCPLHCFMGVRDPAGAWPGLTTGIGEPCLPSPPVRVSSAS